MKRAPGYNGCMFNFVRLSRVERGLLTEPTMAHISLVRTIHAFSCNHAPDFR